MILISIHDVKADTYSPLVLAENEDAARRQFSMLVNDQNDTLISTHPQDFNLLSFGSWTTDFDRASGKRDPVLKAFTEIICLGSGVDFKVKEK